MYNLLCISNRHLCHGDFPSRIQQICDMGIPVILREKDLYEKEYFNLLGQICRTEIIAHKYVDAALEFGCSAIHMPLPLANERCREFECFGISTHSINEAKTAEAFGASYITAGHIFSTDCKKGIPPKGIELLHTLKSEIHIPVFALGGITPQNYRFAINAGADGICIMSGFMQCKNLEKFVQSLEF